jgi:hypothetical protein
MQVSRGSLRIALIVSFICMMPAVAWALSDADEAMERARKAADRVFSKILLDSEVGRSAKSSSPAPKPAAPRPSIRPAAVPKAPSPQNAAASAPSTAMATLAARPSDKPIGAPTDTGLLFDFEDDTEGFLLRDRGDFEVVKGGAVRLSAESARGHSSLSASSPRDAWIGVEFDPPRDWSGYRLVMFAARGAPEGDLMIGLKVGSEWEWCPARAKPVGTSGTFTLYAAPLGGLSCPGWEPTEIRALHIGVDAGQSLLVDHIRLQP